MNCVLVLIKRKMEEISQRRERRDKKLNYRGVKGPADI